jgi:hypothetical protein
MSELRVKTLGRNEFAERRNFFLFSFFFAAYIFLFCWLGRYAFPSADDFAFTNDLIANGFWEAQRRMYFSWSGRLTSMSLLYLSYSLGMENIYPFLASFTSLLNLTVIFLLLRVLLRDESRWRLLTLSLLLQAVCLASTPGHNEILYWLCGSYYTWSATLATLCLAMSVRVLRDRKKGVFFFALLVLVFLNGMLIETMTAMQVGVAFVFTVYFLCRKQYASAKLMAFILAAALCGLLVTLTAPGNFIRMGKISLPVRLFETIATAAAFGGITSIKFFTKPIVYLAILYSPVIAARVKPFDPVLSKHLRAWHIFVLVVLIASLQQAVGGATMGAGLPARSEGLAIWVMGAAWLLLWAFGYRNEETFEKIRSLGIFPWRGALLILCLLLSGNFIALLQDLRIAPLYVAEQRQREALVARQKAEGKADIVVPVLTVKPTLLFFSDLRPSPNDWKNHAFAAYYGVRSISALPEELLRDEKAQSDFQEGNLSGLEALALAGNSEAQFMLGEIYDTTFAPANNVAKDNAAAAKWYRMAAEQGHSHAQRRLARLYALGMGVPRSYTRALGWILRSNFQDYRP